MLFLNDVGYCPSACQQESTMYLCRNGTDVMDGFDGIEFIMMLGGSLNVASRKSIWVKV